MIVIPNSSSESNTVCNNLLLKDRANSVSLVLRQDVVQWVPGKQQQRYIMDCNGNAWDAR